MLLSTVTLRALHRGVERGGRPGPGLLSGAARPSGGRWGRPRAISSPLRGSFLDDLPLGDQVDDRDGDFAELDPCADEGREGAVLAPQRDGPIPGSGKGEGFNAGRREPNPGTLCLS